MDSVMTAANGENADNSFAKSLRNMEKSMQNLASLTSTMDRFTKATYTDLQTTISHMANITSSLEKSSVDIKSIMNNVGTITDQVAQAERSVYERLPFHTQLEAGTVLVKLDFSEAVNAPLLENEWVTFFRTSYQRAVDNFYVAQIDKPYVLLLDQFSLDLLTRDYNAVMRFTYLFDAVEQLGVGVLVRNVDSQPELTREAIEQMKVVMQNSRDVSEDVKRKTLAGVDRLTSRLGQAGNQAKRVFASLS